ncbi:response regulator [Nitrospira sp. KM1]|uniref:response regulator n=1 Tax=Nitrospira sp. KM1 TaxID=1936990 RepID=UPI001E347B93|nr:response regulator [Nitrospira sp. KM1]
MLSEYDNIQVVAEAGDGLEAIKVTEIFRPHVVVMDVHMPHLNGFIATSMIKAQFPDIIVIGLSLYGDGRTEEGMLKAGASRHLRKELAGEQLYDAIMDLTRQSIAQTSNFQHAVRFYSNYQENESYVSNYALEGLYAGEFVVIIATGRLCRAVADHMALALPRSFLREGTAPKYLALDADEVLSSFATKDDLDQDRFDHVLDGILGKVCKARNPVRVYGEMVIRLWERGYPKAAFELEQFWNVFGGRYNFSLLCAYPLELFRNGDQQQFIDACRFHSQVTLSDPA